MEGLRRRLAFHFSVSMTTRPPRPGEVDGSDYWFVDRDTFETAVAAGRMVEWAEYSGHLYGTPVASIAGARAGGSDVLLDIEILGAQQVRRAFPEALMVFVLPPSLEVLEERLRGRGDTPDVEVRERLEVAGWQMEQAEGLFDHFVVNDDLETAVAEVAGILALPSDPREHQ